MSQHVPSCDLSIIIPSYLEEENLRILLPRIQDTLSHMRIQYEVIVVDTIKPLDATEKACAENRVIYVNREGGDAYGNAIRTGILKARGHYTIFMDADGSHSPEFIKELYQPREQYDVVIASRYVPGGETDNPKILILMSLVVNVVYSVVLGLNCKDVSNSFKLYHTNDLKALTLHCDNFDIVEEILYKLKKSKKNLTIRELPYTFKKRMFGNTKRNIVIFMFSYVFTLIRLRFGK